MSILKKSNFWNLLIINEKEVLSGKFIFTLIDIIMKNIQLNFVVLDDIDAVGVNSYRYFKENEKSIIKINEMLNKVINIEQFIWGDFFLFISYPLCWQNSQNKDYPDAITQSDITIRIIDGACVYVYTQYNEIVELIKKKYKIESLRSDLLANLDYPY